MSGFFDNNKPRAVKFTKHGDKVTGIVHELNKPVQLAFDANGRPNGPKFDENGNIVLQVEVVLALTDEDGAPTPDLVVLRTGGSIYTGGYGATEVARVGSGLSYSIGEAVLAAGGTDLEVGDTLSVTYSADDKPTAEGLNGAKLYDVVVVKG